MKSININLFTSNIIIKENTKLEIEYRTDPQKLDQEIQPLGVSACGA